MASPDQRRPGKPTNVRVVPGGTTSADRRSSLTISWRPQPRGGKAITGVELQVYLNAPQNYYIDEYKAENIPTIPTTFTTKLLRPNTTRRYRVRNRDSDGWGPWSDAKEGTTDKAWAGAPTIGSISAPSPSMVSVSWSAPADNGGSPITGYLVRVWELNPVKYVFETDVAASTRVFTITGLKAAKEHQVNISAANKIERISVYAGVEKITTKAATPPDAPTNLTATADGRTTINISWTAPVETGGAPVDYNVFYSTSGRQPWNAVVNRTTKTSVSDTGLDPGTTRYYRVTARNKEGFSDGIDTPSGTTTDEATAPGRPTSLSATVTGPTTISLSWGPPTDDGGSPITLYEIVIARNDNAEVAVRTTVEPTVTSYMATGLTPSTQYAIGVAARNSIGFSTSSTLKTTDAATAPAAPTGLTATASGQTTINLSWTAPTNTGGASITGYRIEVSPNGTSNWTERQANTGSTATTYAHTGLSAGTTRHYRVSAINSAGTGAASSVASATTNSAPGAPTGLRATALDQNRIRLSWTAPTRTGGAAITGYKIEYSENNSEWLIWLANTNSTTTTYTVGGMRAGQTRHFRVSAVNSVGPGPVSNVATGTTNASVSSAPRSLTAVADGPTAIDLSWTAPASTGGSAIIGYRIEVSPTGTGDTWNDVEDDTESTGTTYEHTGLSAGTTRHYRVYAINSVGESAASNKANATTVTRPGAPRNLTATASGQTIINLAWEVPSSDGGAAISGYRVQWSANGTSNWQNVSPGHTGTGRTYRDSGLSAGTTRHYRVYARNSVGDSNSPSNTDDATTAAATRPGAPRNLTATASGQTIINLAWESPSSDGGTAISGYRVQWSANGNSGWTNVSPAHTGTVRTYSDTGLSAGTRRYYRVYARNSVGDSNNPSNTADATTSTPTATRPAAPTSLTATAAGQTTINLRWTAPTNTGGADITGYRIEVSPNGTSNWTNQQANTRSTATTYAHTGLSAGTTRHYRVSAINSVGTGAASNVDDATTDAATRPAAPTGLTATAAGQTTITLSWTAPTNTGGASITGYRIEVSPNGTTNWTNLQANTRLTTTRYSHTGLSAGTTRHYRVSAINSVGTGAASNVASATTSTPTATRPAAPTGLTATAAGQTNINLRWTAPTNTGGAAITGYQIEVSPNGTSNWTNLQANTGSPATSYSHTGLSAGTTRHYRVSAINSVGTGAASNVDDATTDAATRPAAPTGLTATADGQTTINLSWTAPTTTGGAAITGYRIEVSPNGTSNWTNLQANTGLTTTSYSHTGLSAGDTRHYRVSAINSAGTGAASNVASATTSTPTITAPAAPTGLTATAAGQTTINLSWTAPTTTGGASITGYQIEVSPNGTSNWTNLQANTGSTTTTYAHTGLSAGETRHYRVRAINSVGTGAASNVDVATTDTPTATAPAAPTGLTATADGPTTISLSWTAPTNTGGASITGYRIEVSPNGTSNWTNLQANTGSPATSYSHTGLSAGTTRYYQISAINSAGTGAASNVASATTSSASTMLSFTSTVKAQRYPVGLAIRDLALPFAIGGMRPYTYTLSPETLPAGLSYDKTARTIGGTPTSVTPAQTFVWTVVDAAAAEVTVEFSLEVYRMTFVAQVNHQSYVQGELIDPLVLPAVTGGEDPIAYTIHPLPLPNGLQYEAGSRTIRGTPTQITPPLELTYTATDANQAQDSLKFNIEVVSSVNTQQETELANQLIVHANYPNPFTHSTRIVFDLPWPAQVQVDIMDMTGRRVYTKPAKNLSSGKKQSVELHDLALPAGVYLYRMVATSLDSGTSTVHVGQLMSLR